ncbi:MAG: hypothetical protein ACI8Q3_002721, partial [Marinomonas primoryensis]
ASVAQEGLIRKVSAANKSTAATADKPT